MDNRQHDYTLRRCGCPFPMGIIIVIREGTSNPLYLNIDGKAIEIKEKSDALVHPFYVQTCI